MSLFSVFSIAGAALDAQSQRLNLVSSNLANADAVSSSSGSTYRARHAVFQSVLRDARGTRLPAASVRVSAVVESQAPLREEYRPEHPEADADGYIHLPNVRVVEEMADMIAASRAFQNNVEVMNTSKQMLLRTLSLGR